MECQWKPPPAATKKKSIHEFEAYAVSKSDWCSAFEKEPDDVATPDFSKVTRVEVIDENGRAYVRGSAYRNAVVRVSVQDDGRTLKLFVGWMKVEDMYETRK